MFTSKDIYCISNFFTDEEIDIFLSKHNAYSDDGWGKAALTGPKKYDPSVRKTKSKLLSPSSKDLLLMKFVYGVVEANHKKFKKNIKSFFIEPITFLKYTEDLNFFKRHKDFDRSGHITFVRQLSCIAILSKITDYDGGGLAFFGNEQGESRFRLQTEKGTLIVFPSEMYHEVTPVTRGTRFSLVMWVG